MADLQLYLEAERRGLLPPDKAGLLDEARKRGLLDAKPAEPVAAEKPSEVPQGRRSRRGPIEDMTGEQIAQGIGNLAAGAVRGAGSIGATILSPIDALARAVGIENSVIGRSDRREAMDTALRMMGANSESMDYATGKLGSEVAGTMGVGGALAKGVATVPALAPFAKSIATGGFQTGMPPGVLNALTRFMGGGITGAASNALIDPSTAGEGAVLGAVIPGVGAPIVQGATKVIGRGYDLLAGNAAKVKAGEIARDVAGSEIGRIRAANAAAPSNVTAGQAAAGIDRDVWQAFADLAAGKDTNSVYRKLADDQKRAQLDLLTRLAGGASQTEAKAARGAEKATLNALTTPMRETELGAANIAGDLKPKLEGEAARMAEAAANKVEDVRRFTAAGQRAPNVAPAMSTPSGLPIPSRYTYVGGDLAERAEQVATQAAEGSLRFGEASRFAQAAADSLESHGLRPLTADSVAGRVRSILKNPEFAGNDVIESSVKGLADDIAKWTKEGGVIDAFALESIRKNSVNATIQKLRPGLDQAAQKNLAAGVLSKIKPMIDDAIEKAGGTGWRDYLKTYEMGAQAIDQKKLAAEALKMFQDSPQKFIKLVEGNDPKAVEKVFGPGSFDIVKEMGAKMRPLEQVAGELTRDIAIKKQAEAGREGLSRILESDLVRFRFPAFLSAKTTIANKSLDLLSERIGRKTMDAIVEGMKSGKSANEMLDYLPAAERNKVLRAIGNVEAWNPAIGKAARAGQISSIQSTNNNALVDENRNQLGR